MAKLIFNGTCLKAVKVSGFLSRMKTFKGKKILKNRKKKGRYVLAISLKKIK